VSFLDFLRASGERGDLAALDGLYLHRAHREAHGRTLVGRDAIRAVLAAEIAESPERQVAIDADLGDVVAVSVTGGEAEHRRAHHWLTWEGERIARELVVGDAPSGAPGGSADRIMFRPLGERRAGQGQFAVGTQALLPSEPSAGARAVLDGLHRMWNGRDFSSIDQLYANDAEWTGRGGQSDLRGWLSGLLTSLPDSWLLFERVIERGDQLAVLWRLVADEGERRLHLIGSSILSIEGGKIRREDTLADEADLLVQRTSPIIDL
jgi:hypothetical protein